MRREPFQRNSYRNPGGVLADSGQTPGRDGNGVGTKGWVGGGLSPARDRTPDVVSPNPVQHSELTAVSPEKKKILPDGGDRIVQVLQGGIDSLMLNDRGLPWPGPNRATIARLLATYPADLCLKAAREAREIVQAQDRAPNISALFEKKCRDLAEVRNAVRDGLGAL